MSPKPDAERTEWVIRKGKLNGKNRSRGEDYDWATLQAATGPLKGYFLDVERVEGGPGDADTFHFALHKVPKWNVEVQRYYHHK